MTVTHARVVEGSAFVVLARVLGLDGQPVTPAAVASLSVASVDVADGSTVATLTPPVSGTVFATLQLDGRWQLDAKGYNVALAVPGSAVPLGGRTYSVALTVTPAAGYPFRLVWRVQTIAVADPA